MKRSFPTCGARPRWTGLVAAVLMLGSSEIPAFAPEIPPGSHPIQTDAWQDPPREARPVARWWWPGGSADAETVERHLAAIATAGFGGVELQPLLLGIGEDELAADAALRTVGEPAFREAVAHAAASATAHGLAFDLTLGSGWPGGLPTAKANAERQLLMAHVDVRGPVELDRPLPPAPDQSYRRSVERVLDVLGPPDPDTSLLAVLAARLGPEREGVPTLEEVWNLANALEGERLRWSVPEGRWRIYAFYENSTGHFVMGGAFPGDEEDALVVDHLSRRGADALLEGYADPLLAEIAAGGVRDVFVDSFELLGELPFTGDFPAEFLARTGYDIGPVLPYLFRRGGEAKYAEPLDLFGRMGGPLALAATPGEAERAREDYERVRRELFEEVFLARFAEWARRNGVGLRLQAHGGFGDVLDGYALSDVPESEGLYAGGRFDFLKLASSAAHVAGRRWSSSESFITLRLFGTGLSRDELRMLAGRAYSAGINRLAFHGVSLPYRRQDGKPWFPFPGGFGRILAGPLPMSLDVDAERLAGLPDFNRFLSRLSVAMSSGAPAADLAWLRADPAFPDEASFQIGRIEARAGESPTTAALRARGLVHDRVSRRMLAGARVVDGVLQVGHGRYRALLLDPLGVAEPELAERIAEIAEAGIPVLALGALPARAPGLREPVARDQRVRKASARLSSRAAEVEAGGLEALLSAKVRGALVEPAPGESLDVSLHRRRTPKGDVLLVFNESWSREEARLRFVAGGGPLLRWDPASGGVSPLRERVEAGEVVSLELSAAETLVLTLGRSASRAETEN